MEMLRAKNLQYFILFLIFLDVLIKGLFTTSQISYVNKVKNLLKNSWLLRLDVVGKLNCYLPGVPEKTQQI